MQGVPAPPFPGDPGFKRRVASAPFPIAGEKTSPCENRHSSPFLHVPVSKKNYYLELRAWIIIIIIRTIVIIRRHSGSNNRLR